MLKILRASVLATMAMVFCFSVKAQTSAHPLSAPGADVPWTQKQLIEPATLATELKSSTAGLPVIFNIGAVEDIKGAKHIGPVNKTENLEKLKEEVKTLPKNRAIVIYCGCCPFAKCPNIRPAFVELNKLGYTHVMVLDLPVNLKTNWIANNYPLAEK